jgi:hypothetical protein
MSGLTPVCNESKPSVSIKGEKMEAGVMTRGPFEEDKRMPDEEMVVYPFLKRN